MAPSRETTSSLSKLRDRIRAKTHQWRANLRNILPGRRETAARSESPASSESLLPGFVPLVTAARSETPTPAPLPYTNLQPENLFSHAEEHQRERAEMNGRGRVALAEGRPTVRVIKGCLNDYIPWVSVARRREVRESKGGMSTRRGERCKKAKVA
jgi:hypothetical protein